MLIRRSRLIRPSHRARAATLLVSLACVAACSPTKIVGDLNTTVPADTTTTTLAPPTGDLVSLVRQLADTAAGLGDAIVDKDNADADARVARSEAILAVLEPKIMDSGLDILEDVQRIVGLVRTAVERKRPAEADKAQKFATLVADSLPS